ncbi:transposase [Microtetraspora glauca]|uniref:transposase n=1 Tax=Microtetraspora glauca TaxID=1996 RepID=UPI003F4D60B3
MLEKVRVRGPVGRPRTRPDAVAGDKAYSSRGNRTHLRKRHIKAVIPEKKDQAANRKKKARHRHPIRQDPGQLPRRPPPARLDDLDQRPHRDQPLITTRYVPWRQAHCRLRWWPG